MRKFFRDKPSGLLCYSELLSYSRRNSKPFLLANDSILFLKFDCQTNVQTMSSKLMHPLVVDLS
jgi:hypothetical protein